MVKRHGHFPTREAAEHYKRYLEALEKERLKNPRVKIYRKYRVKKLANGKYSVQSNRYERK